MVIGVPDGLGSSFVHSPIPGVVHGLKTVRLPEGGSCESLDIALEGSFERLGKRRERYMWKSMKRLDMLQALKEKGVIDAVRSGGPLADLLSEPTPKSILVLSSVDEEPYVKTQTTTMERRPADVLEGLSILARLLEPSLLLILLDSTFAGKDTIVEKLLGQKDAFEYPVEVQSIEPRYPPRPIEISSKPFIAAANGGPRRYIMRPSTLLAVFEAVVESRPFVERYITIGGGAIRRPSVLKARIGTPIGDLIEECGGLLRSPERLVLGGPFTGLAATDLDMPVTKTTGSVLALLSDETRKGRERPCIHCGRCNEFCPVQLDPEALYRRLVVDRIQEAQDLGMANCIICGCCSYICPARIPLSQTFAGHLGTIPQQS
jgi:electron transport complex protein RnfC